MRTPTWISWAYVGPAAVIMALACLLPLLSALQLGFYDWSMGTPWSEARWVGWQAFEKALGDPAVWRSLWTTLLFAAICVTSEMVLGTALALALEGRVRGMAVYRTLFILPMMMAPIAVGLIWRYLFDAQFGPLNALLGAVGLAPVGWLSQEGTAFAAIIIADIWQWTPFVFIMMIAGLAGLDSSVVEAARIDGARWYQVIWRVKLPMVRNVIMITLLMRLIDAFRVLEVIYILTFGGPGDSTEILSMHIYKTAFIGQHLGTASAVSVLLLIVVAGLSFAALRFANPFAAEERA